MGSALSEKWLAREDARLQLARLRQEESGSLDAAMDRACTIAERALNVERVSVWVVEADVLRCIHLSDRDANPLPIQTLDAEQLGQYDRGMRERRVLVADEVRTHPITSALYESYFAPLGITSTLDAGLYRAGRFAGMVCHENRGDGPRRWTDGEADFACSTADIIGALLVANDLVAAEELLAEREVALRDALASDGLARIARGVAHDVNNLLVVVFGGVSLLERANGSRERIEEATSSIRDAANSAARLLRQLLPFGKQPIDEEHSTVDAVVAGSEATLRKLGGADRRIELELFSGDLDAPIDAARLEQLVFNLVVNARDATRPGGLIRVRTFSDTQSDQVVLEVIDDGAGMDESIRVRVLEPFFTTKDGGANGGLGLSIVDGIARASGGHVEVESEVGRGSTFRVVLPRAHRPPSDRVPV